MRIFQTLARRYRGTRQLCALLFVTSIVVVANVTGAAQTLEAPAISIENFGRVNDHYYRGSQPGLNQFAELKRLGVKTIIDLRQDRLDEALKWAHAIGLEYINIPLTTKRPATEEQTTYFLSLVNDPAKWPVYVHCKGGKHRTGEMTALQRITNEGWTAEQAYDEMKKYDFEDSFFYPRSLKKFVFSYYQRFAASKRN